MKVMVCSYDEVIVSMSHDEFNGITGHSVGDMYGNGGTAHRHLVGKKFDLQRAIDAMCELRIASETHVKVIAAIDKIKQGLERAFFPIDDFKKLPDCELK